MAACADNKLMDKSRELAPKLTEIYRELHQIPELAFEEYKTAEIIERILKSEAIGEIRTGIAGTGITACVGRGAPKVALRADMDALPVTEQTGLPYSSKHPGKMHACGHDVHMTAVLGAGMLLKEYLSEQHGGVKLIFQPAEETPPGGARGMIRQGVINEELEAIVGLHSQPFLPAGSIGVKEGPIMAAADMFTLTIAGQGGHGALPHQTRDAIVVGSHVVQTLQTVVSRMVDPLEPAVISVGSFHAGTKANIIAGQARLEGTVRTLTAETRERMPKLMEQVIKGICDSYQVEYQFSYEWGYPPVVNDTSLVALLRDSAQRLLGEENVYQIPHPSMGGEDFSYYLESVPGVYFYLGVGNEKLARQYPWHHPRFQADEAALPVAAAVLAQVALDVLGGQDE